MKIRLSLIIVLILFLQVPISYAKKKPGSCDPNLNQTRTKGYQQGALREKVEVKGAKESKEVLDLLKKARLLNKLNKLDAAIMVYSGILKKDPQNLAAYEDMLQIFFKTNNWALVISTLEKIVKLKPNDRISREVLVIVYNFYEIPERALIIQLELAALEPENQGYLLALAKTLNSYGLIDETIEVYDKLHKLDKNNVKYISLLALLYGQKGLLDKSVFYYEKLAELSSNKSQAKMKLARAYLENDRPLKALGIYQEALNREPNNSLLKEEINYVNAEIGRYYYNRKRFVQARNHFDQSSKGEYPYPFAVEYLQEIDSEMSFQPFYNLKVHKYKFDEDITKSIHSLGTKLPDYSFMKKGDIILKHYRLDTSPRDVEVNEIEAGVNLDLGDYLRTNLSLGYSAPNYSGNSTGEMIYGNTWEWYIDQESNLEFGFIRKRVFDSIVSVDKNIFKTEYYLGADHLFFKRLFTAFEYKYSHFSDSNHSNALSFDMSYNVFQYNSIPENVEEKPPLRERVKHSLSCGINFEYTSFQELSEEYFTVDDQLVYSIHGEYFISPINDFNIKTSASYGRTNKSENTWSGSISLTYILPFKVHSELGYNISNFISTKHGTQEINNETNTDHTFQLKFLIYF